MADANGVPCYVAGSGTAAIVVLHDAFGGRSGRTRALADALAERVGALVVVPELFDGGAAGGPAGRVIDELTAPDGPRRPWYTAPWRFLRGLGNAPGMFGGLKRHPWSVVGPKLMDCVVPWVHDQGATRLGLLGFCWGGWAALHASAEPGFVCAAAAHPSYQLCGMHGEDRDDLVTAVRCPQLVVASAGEPAYCKPGGDMERILSTKPFGPECEFHAFGRQAHGFVNRGDWADAKVGEDAEEAVRIICRFLAARLAPGQEEGSD